MTKTIFIRFYFIILSNVTPQKVFETLIPQRYYLQKAQVPNR